MNANVATDNRIALTVATGDPLDPRQFTVRERMSTLFQIDVIAFSRDPNLRFSDIVGQEATLALNPGSERERSWRGICNHMEQIATEPKGYSTYHFSVVPLFWLATQRRNYRIFQQLSDPDIARKLLGEWGVEHEARFDGGAHKPRKYRVQYAETDYAFVCRLLEDAGISFYFDERSTLVLSDAPQRNEARPELPFTAMEQLAPLTEYVTDVSLGQQVRPGAYTVRDHDYRRPASFPLLGQATAGTGVEARLERFHYVPGAMLFGGDGGAASPVADDRGAARHSAAEGAAIAQRRLEAKRAQAQHIGFDTTAHDLRPGVVVTIANHPHAVLADGQRILVLETVVSGTAEESWHHRCDAVSASSPYRPPLLTPKPRVQGVESATVVGPAGEEIHCDEFGRVRVHFHWDRESQMNEKSSCWIHVSQPWSGTGFGGTNLPRVGQEVIVDFLGGDPDRPVITGRVYTNVNKTPYRLPEHKTRSGWRSMSSPGGGGFNELMFEDRKGEEQVYLQAEKNMDVLVKNDQSLTVNNDREKTVLNDETTVVKHDRTETVENDETITIKHDRTETVENDETITIKHDRTETVENDETITINHDRIELVANDEDITIGNNRALTIVKSSREMVGENRSRAVGANESLLIGQNRTLVVGESQSAAVGGKETRQIGDDQSLSIGKNRSLSVGKNQSTTIGSSFQLKVGKSSSEQVMLAKSTQVGGAYSINVAGAMSTTVGAMSTEQVGLMKKVTVGAMLNISCGASSLTMDASGKITLKGTEILIEGAKVKVIGDPIELN